MKRALSSCWTLLLAVVLLGAAGATAFAGRPTIAVLGLEVVDAGGQIDQASTGVARDLTEGLRSRAKVGSGPFQLQPGSDKELIDEKLIKNCDNEAIPCMAQIGKDLGADFLMYGQLRKASDGYVVTLNLLNVGKKKFEKAKAPLLIPFDKKDPQALQEAARKAYNDLSGITDAGTLVVKANTPNGTVFVDDTARAQLVNGAATVGPLPEGRYRVAVEAEGYKRSEEMVVTMRSGETVTQDVKLVVVDREYSGTTSSAGGSGAWKGAFAVSTVVTAASGALWIYGWKKLPTQAELQASGAPAGYDESRCPRKEDFGTSGNKTIDDACSGYSLSKWGIVGVSVGGVAMAFTGYMAFMRSGGEARPVGMSTTGRRTKRKKELAITPILSPDGGGATFRLDW
ncbi:MAG: carboxypeptidase-like regulatory domain-containing protein [Kofleriaceae bacterium]|nr:carboxypeptidase-like regulatory domain-containing protein [Kofleriaceae bacterium]